MGNFSPDILITWLLTSLQSLPDERKGDNTRYEVVDAGLGAFSLFFTQCPSFLEFQRQMENATGKSNANSLFAMRAIPKDQQIRRLLDTADPQILFPVFNRCLRMLTKTGEITRFQTDLGYLLIFDGTQSVSSAKIHCSSCLIKKDAQGTRHYYHSLLTPILAKPEGTHVLPLIPEYISNTDGTSKQDCENKAAKRSLERNGGELLFLLKKITVLGDDLYCHQPLIEKLKGSGFHYILICKPDSHAFLYDWLSGIPEGKQAFEINAVTSRVYTGGHHETITYRYINTVPLRDGKDAVFVNWCEMRIVNEKTQKTVYLNSFVTDHQISDENVSLICTTGRTRWKIENENNNTLKTKGYHFEHNYGHGEKYLVNFLNTLMLLAFLFHTLLDLFYAPFIFLRGKFTRQAFFHAIRALTQLFYCSSWEHLFAAMRYGLEKGLPLPPYPYAPLPSG